MVRGSAGRHTESTRCLRAVQAGSREGLGLSRRGMQGGFRPYPELPKAINSGIVLP